MKSILTKLTESIGNNIATNHNKNEFLNEKLSLTSDYNLSDLDPDKLQDILKANPDLDDAGIEMMISDAKPVLQERVFTNIIAKENKSINGDDKII